jgi:hypothetical protein
MLRINNAKALRRSVAEGQREFLICLQAGIFSRKTIAACADGRFKIVNHVDDSVQKLTARQLYTRSNIGNAMRLGAFLAETPDDYQREAASANDNRHA